MSLIEQEVDTQTDRQQELSPRELMPEEPRCEYLKRVRVRWDNVWLGVILGHLLFYSDLHDCSKTPALIFLKGGGTLVHIFEYLFYSLN